MMNNKVAACILHASIDLLCQRLALRRISSLFTMNLLNKKHREAITRNGTTSFYRSESTREQCKMTKRHPDKARLGHRLS